MYRFLYKEHVLAETMKFVRRAASRLNNTA